MKKAILLILFLMFLTLPSFAGTASVFENTSANKLRETIITLYTLEGAHIESYQNNVNSFSISKNNLTSLYNTKANFNYSIVQKGKDSVVSLTMSVGVGGYASVATLYCEEKAELDRIKDKLFGYYSYGLAYPVKIYFYNEYDENGRLMQKNIIGGSQIFRGFKLTGVKYDAKAKGLYIGDRIVKVNGKKVGKYTVPELENLLKPMSKKDVVDITYKRKGKLKDVRLVPTFVKPSVNL